MKAMILDRCAAAETAPLQWREVPAPEPGPGEVRVRVRACGVCRTDLHVIEGELPPLDHPVTPGHMIVGEVDGRGPDTDRFRIGDRVGIAWLRQTCGECVYCRAGQENLCENAVFNGYHAHGGYAEYTVAPEAFIYPMPEIFGDAEATPLLCAGIIGYRSIKRSLVRPGDRLALYGFGNSAHVVIQIAVHWGCPVYVVTRTPAHREQARRLGARWAGADAAEMPELADSAIIFAPAGGLVLAALEQLRPGGTLALAGIYMTEIPAMDYEKHLFYEKNVHSVTANTREDGMELLRTAAEIPIRPEVQLFPLKEANEVLLKLKNSKIEGSAVLIP